MPTTHISTSTTDMISDLFDRSVRRLDTQLELGKITRQQHQQQLRHMVEAAS